MYQAPMPIWNAIAQSQPLSPRWRPIFEAADLPTALAPLEAELERKGTDAKVTRAFLLTAPLLVENKAISGYVQESDRPELRASLPEVLSLTEATDLAKAEFRLTPAQERRLRLLLAQELTRSARSQRSEPQTA